MHDSSIDIPTLQAATVTRTMRGKMLVIEDDVQGIARELAELDDSLHLHYSPEEDVFVVSQHIPGADGSVTEHFVCAMRAPIDKRLVHRVRQVTSDSYDINAELDKTDAEIERQRNHDHRENVGPVAERLLHAMRKDLHLDKDRTFLK